MPKREAPLTSLQDYIPLEAAPLIFEYLKQYKVHLTITKNRKSVLGDYRHAHGEKNHRISINGDLNKYSFLITLIHELAHLVTFIRYSNQVMAHGKEWKSVYRSLLIKFLQPSIFTADILQALERSLHNLPASSCADENLMRILMKYDEKEGGLVLIEAVQDETLFVTGDSRIFRKGPRLRKRFQCVEVSTGRTYLFSPLYEVTPLGTL